MALAIDASSPSATHSANTTTSALTSAAFSPPAGSVIFVFWAANDDPGISQPGAPSITDSLGGHLTYSQTDWSRAADTANTGNGQAAIWWAPCPSAQTNMTITVTNGNTNATSGNDAHLRVVVFTGAATTQNGAHGKGGGTTQTGTATYTSTAGNSWGFLAFADWNASASHPTVQSGCTEDSWTTLSTQSTGWVIRRTATTTTAGTSVTVGASAPTVEGRWAYVEVLPSVAAASAGRQPLIVGPLQAATRPAPAIISRNTLVDPPVLTTRAPLVVTQAAPKPVANQATTLRSGLVDAVAPAASTPQPLVVSRPSPAVVPAPATLSRASLQDFATPQPLVVSRPSPAVVPAPAMLGRASLQDFATPGPVVVGWKVPPAAPAPPLISRNTLADPPVLTTPSALVVSRPVTVIVPPAALLSRSSLVDVATPSVATPQAIVVTSAFQPAKTAAALIRSTLSDPPILTAPVPLVVTSQPARNIPAPATLSRASLQDFATPGPLVVSSPWRAPATAQAALFRTPLAPPPAPRPIVSPVPLVAPWLAGPVIVRAPAAPAAGVTTAKATSQPAVTANRTSSPAVAATDTSSPAVTANRTSSPAVAANRTSSPAVTARATSTGGVA